jgi:hypothetical protein
MVAAAGLITAEEEAQDERDRGILKRNMIVRASLNLSPVTSTRVALPLPAVTSHHRAVTYKSHEMLWSFLSQANKQSGQINQVP